MKYGPADRQSKNFQDQRGMELPAIGSPMDMAWLLNMMINPIMPKGQPAPGIVAPVGDQLSFGEEQGVGRFASPNLGSTPNAAPGFKAQTPVPQQPMPRSPPMSPIPENSPFPPMQNPQSFPPLIQHNDPMTKMLMQMLMPQGQ